MVDLAESMKKKVIIHLHAYQPISMTSEVYRHDPFKYSKSIITDMGRIAWYSIAQDQYSGILRMPSAYLLLLIRLWLAKANAIITNSRKQLEILLSTFPFLKSKMRMIYNPPPEIHVEKKLTEHPHFIYLGGDSYIKGFPVIVKSLYKVRDKNMFNNAEFIFAGRYHSRSLSILNKVTKLCKHSVSVNLLGQINYERVKSLHEKAWALLFPSQCEEPLPYAIMESIITGTIPITSRVGGVEEMLPSDFRVFSLDYINEDELIKKLEVVANLDRNAVQELGYRLREHARRLFDSEKIRNELIKVFADVNN